MNTIDFGRLISSDSQAYLRINRHEFPIKISNLRITSGFGMYEDITFKGEVLTLMEHGYGDYAKYVTCDIDRSKRLANSMYGRRSGNKLPTIKNVIFNPPATIVFWSDDTKTVVKTQNNELYDPEKGLAMAITKKALGNEGNYFEVIKKWTKDNDRGAFLQNEFNDAIHRDSETISSYLDVEIAYNVLVNTLHDKKSTKAQMAAAMEEAIGYLGEVLDD